MTHSDDCNLHVSRNELKKLYVSADEREREREGKEAPKASVHIDTILTHSRSIQTHIQRVNPWQYFCSLFEVVSHGRLQDCGSVSPTQTHAGSQGKRECSEKKEKTDRGASRSRRRRRRRRRRSASPQTHSSSSHPYLSVSRRALAADTDRERSENRLRLFTATWFFAPPPSFYPFPLALMRSYLALSYSHRLGEIETARWGHSEDITEAASASERGDLSFRFVAGLN